MKFIAHRGNTHGPNPTSENDPKHIEFVIRVYGFDVEVDVWRVDEIMFLGHDEPQYKIDESFLRRYRDRLWCHAKNMDALTWLLNHDYHTFFHDVDEYTLTSKGVVWTFPGNPVPKNGVIVMPERTRDRVKFIRENQHAAYYCSDFFEVLR